MPAPSAVEKLLLVRGGTAIGVAGLRRMLKQMSRRTRLDPAAVLGETMEALNLARRLGDDDATARLCRARGHALRADSRYREALQAYRESIRVFQSAGDHVEAAVSRIGAVDSLMYLGNYNEALAEGRRAHRYFQKIGDRNRQARVATNIGNIHHRRDDPKSALAAYDTARRHFSRTDDAGSMALIEFNRGNVLGSLARFAEARRAYATARRTFAAQRLRSRTAQVDYNLAYLQYLENLLPDALESIEVLKPVFDKLGDRRHEALCRLDQSEILLRLNLWSDAEAMATGALSGFESLGMKYEEAKARAFRGAARWRVGDGDWGREDLASAAAMFEREGNVVWQGETVLRLAQLALDNEDRKGAIEAARCARALLRETPWSDGTGRSWLAEATALRREGRRKRAATCLEKALAESRRTRSHWLAADARELAGLLALDAGNLAAARRNFRAAIRKIESLRAMLSSDDFRAAFFRDRDRPYVGLARVELAADRPEEAFRALERGRARALLDMLAQVRRPGRGRARLRAEAEDLLTALDQRLHGRSVVSQKRDWSTPDPSRAETLSLEARAGGVLRRLGYEDGVRSALPDIDATRIRKSLRPDETLLTFFEIDGTLNAFRLEADRFSTHTDLGSIGAIEALAERLRFQWGRFRLDRSLLERHSGQLSRLARTDLGRLHDHLIRPFGNDTRSRLIIVPPTSLRAVPFGALHDGDSWLAQNRPVTLCPSAAVFESCRTRPAASSKNVLLMGLSDRQTPEVQLEIDDLKRRFRGARRLVGSRATVDAFARHAPDARIIHLATHGAFHSQRPNLSGVRLHDRWLYGYDVARLRLNADLVTLSACATGQSAGWGAGEWMGLARSFLSAGARRVLVGLWELDDAATRAVMNEFYARLGQGASPSIALAWTQAAFAVSGIHPYYWSGFSLLGDA